MQETIWNQGEIPNSYPYMTKDQSCEIAVIGGGLTGALCAWHLCQDGHDTLLVTDGVLAMGNTCASMGVLRMDCEDGLQALIRDIGPGDALQAYRAAQSSVSGVEGIIRGHEEECGFSAQSGVVFTQDAREARYMRGDFEILTRNDFNVEWIDAQAAYNMFSFPLEGAVLFNAGYAQVDPYQLTHFLIADSPNLTVFENTRVTQVRPTSAGIRLRTQFNSNIRAKMVIVATGEAPLSLRPCMLRQRTGMIATLPVPQVDRWHQQAILRERMSGVTVRGAEGSRLLLSAPGAPFYAHAAGLISKSRREELRMRRLKRRLEDMFPQAAQGLTVSHNCLCTSIVTPDGLPVIGPAPNTEGVYTVCGYGEDGAVAGVLAGRLLISWLRGERPPLGRLYDPNRLLYDREE